MNLFNLSRSALAILVCSAINTTFAQPAGGLESSKRLSTSEPKPPPKSRTAKSNAVDAHTTAPLSLSELQAIDNSTTLARIRAQQKIVVAFSKTASPFSVVESDGSPRGFAIDLCTKIAVAIQKHLKLSDLRIEFVSPQFADRLQAVKDGKADMECANTISNEERKQALGFSLPIFLTVSKEPLINPS